VASAVELEAIVRAAKREKVRKVKRGVLNIMLKV